MKQFAVLQHFEQVYVTQFSIVTWTVKTWSPSPLLDYNIRNGKTYQYFKGKPLYPFGYGLSYTSFAYKNLTTNAESLSKTGQISLKVEVTNTGAKAGDEVVQWYVLYPNSKVARPLKQLAGFERVQLKPGETKTVEWVLKAENLAYWDVKSQAFVVEAQPVVVSVGGSSADVKLTKEVGVK
jgi:beta-glucosidase